MSIKEIDDAWHRINAASRAKLIHRAADASGYIDPVVVVVAIPALYRVYYFLRR